MPAAVLAVHLGQSTVNDTSFMAGASPAHPRLQRSQLVEAAIITPLLLLLTFSIVDFASLFYVYLALENGVEPGHALCRDRQVVAGQDARRLDQGGDAEGDADPDDPGRHVLVQPYAARREPLGGGDRRRERHREGHDQLHLDLMTPLIRPFFTNGQISFRVESAMKNERRFD